MADSNGDPGRAGRTAFRLLWPAALACLLLVLVLEETSLIRAFGLEPGDDDAMSAGMAVETLFWVFAAFTVVRWLDLLFWQGYVQKRTGVPVPKLLVDVTSVVVYLAALIVILSFVFDLPVTGLLTTSSIVIAVVGFALRNMISDVFTGVALGVERPFRIGDWIQLQDGKVGRVAMMNWRATRMVTRDEVTVVIPNSQLATEFFSNYSTPEPFFRDEITIVLDYAVTGWRVERLLLSAVLQVLESVELPREPKVRIDTFLAHGIRWELRYWVPDYLERERIRYQVQRNILRNLHFSGIRVPGERIELHTLPREQPQEDIDFLHAIELFAPLTDDELHAIEAKMERRLFRKGDPVVREGEEGSSLFIVKEGSLNVYVEGKDGVETQVNHLAPGSFFGEMSLLTGAPRGATVVPETDTVGFEITKEVLEDIIQARPELAEQLSETLAERQLRTRQAMAELDANTAEQRRRSMATEFLSGMMNFFRLKG